MPLIILTDPVTANSFESLTEFDQFVDVPARKGFGTCYRGKISGITPEAADRYVRFGGNLIQRKAQVFTPEEISTLAKIATDGVNTLAADDEENISDE